MSAKDINALTICPFHRSELGTGWRRSQNTCRIPDEIASHGKGKGVNSSLEEIAPGNAEILLSKLVISNVVALTEDEVDLTLVDALAECYKSVSHWSTRRQILSIISDKVIYRKLQSWIPGLTRYRYNVARQHAHMYEGGAEVETRSVPRMYVSASQLDHFLDFITSEHIIQELLFGEQTLKLSSEKKMTVLNVVRKVIPERVIQQYNLFCTETGFAPMGRSTLRNILDVCSASVRNSLQRLDYFTAQGEQASDDLESVVDKFGEDCGMGSSWVKEKKEQLKEGKRYLKSDYKVPLLSLLSLLLALLLLLLL